MRNSPPFYSNTADNTHCYQAALKMVLGHFLPNEKFTWKRLDVFSAKKPGKWTWPTQALINFHHLGFDVRVKNTFDYHQFVDKGGNYLTEKYGVEVGTSQIAHSDLKQEIKLAKEYLTIFGNKPELPNLDELKLLLSKGYLLIVNVNHHPLYEKPGYSGHFVVVYDIKAQNVHLHDPGLPPKSHAKISLKKFINAWEYPDRESRNYQAFKLSRKSTSGV